VRRRLEWGHAHPHPSQRPRRSFAPDHDRFIAAQWGGGALMVKQGEAMIAVGTD
jgi:hypothetical protein